MWLYSLIRALSEESGQVDTWRMFFAAVAITLVASFPCSQQQLLLAPDPRPALIRSIGRRGYMVPLARFEMIKKLHRDEAR